VRNIPILDVNLSNSILFKPPEASTSNSYELELLTLKNLTIPSMSSNPLA